LSLLPQPSPPKTYAVCIGVINFGPVEHTHEHQRFCNKVASASTRLLNGLSRTWTASAVHPLVLYVDNLCDVGQLLNNLFFGQYRFAVCKGILRASLNRLQQLGFDVDIETMRFTHRQAATPAFFVFTWHGDVELLAADGRFGGPVVHSGGLGLCVPPSFSPQPCGAAASATNHSVPPREWGGVGGGGGGWQPTQPNHNLVCNPTK
jgi:hypothetical protein